MSKRFKFKMKQVVTLLAAFLFSQHCYSQRIDLMLIPFESHGLWGYMNSEKQIIVEPQYDLAYPTYDLMGRVRINGKYGYIDNNGSIVIKPKYQSAEDFKYGRAKVSKDGQVLYINKSGKKYKNKTGFIGGGCGYGMGMYCFSPNLDSSVVYRDSLGKYGIACRRRIGRKDGLTVFAPDTIKPIFDTIVAITHQLMYAKIDNKIAFTHTGYYTAGADRVLERMIFKYDDIKYYQCPQSSVKYHQIIGVEEGGLWGYMHVHNGLQGEFVTDLKYHSISSLVSGYALVEYKPNKWGYISNTGEEFFIR